MTLPEPAGQKVRRPSALDDLSRAARPEPAGNDEVAGIAGSLIDCAISSVALKPMWRPHGRYAYVNRDGSVEHVSWFEYSAFAYRDRLVDVLSRIANVKADDSPLPPSASHMLDKLDDDLRFIVDPAGFFWSGTANLIMELPGFQVRRVARVIDPTITSITRLFMKELTTLQPRWSRVIAQPIDLHTWLRDGTAPRPDILARCENGTDVHVWDVKTSTAPAPREDVALKLMRVHEQYAVPLNAAGFRTHTRVIVATQGRDDAWLTEPFVSDGC